MRVTQLTTYLLSGEVTCDTQLNPYTSLIVCGLHFHGFGRGEFPISMWLGTHSTCMQFTGFPDSCTAGSTRHRQNLSWGEFFALHDEIIKSLELENCSILNIFLKVQSPGVYRPAVNLPHYEHN
jgi:hypothetical protein